MVVKSRSITSAPHTSYDVVWVVSAFNLKELCFCFFTYYRLETRNHIRVGVRAYDRTNNVMGVYGVVDPIAYSLIGSIF